VSFLRRVHIFFSVFEPYEMSASFGARFPIPFFVLVASNAPSIEGIFLFALSFPLFREAIQRGSLCSRPANSKSLP